MPPDLQVVTWRGWGLSKTDADTINIWNSSPSDQWNTVANLALLDSIQGFSQEIANYCDKDNGCIGGYLRESVLWENGAFPAAIGGDVGSPGYVTNPPPRVVSVSLSPTGVQVRCRAVAGRRYRLVYKNTLTDATWAPLNTAIAVGAVMTFQNTPPAGTKFRFYRVEELP